MALAKQGMKQERSNTPCALPVPGIHSSHTSPSQPQRRPGDVFSATKATYNASPSSTPVETKKKEEGGVVAPLLTRSNKIVPLHVPFSNTARLYNQVAHNRLPYSAALVGPSVLSKPEQLAVHSSSSLATQNEPSSSSVNGDHPVRKCGDTAISTVYTSSATHSPTATSTPVEENISIYIANLPYILPHYTLENVKADLQAHLSSVAKVDDIRLDFGKYGRYNQRQVIAFAIFCDINEAKKLLCSRLERFGGQQLRMEVSFLQRTLLLSTTRSAIDLTRFKTTEPWSQDRSKCPLLFHREVKHDSATLTRPIFNELTASTGIVARIREERRWDCRALCKSESDIEFTSDQLPIKTDSSSVVDAPLTEEAGPEVVTPSILMTRVIHRDTPNLDESPQTPLTEFSDTPSFSNTTQDDPTSEEEQEEQEAALPSRIEGVSVDDSDESGKEELQKAASTHVSPISLRREETDPCSVFVSRLSAVDHLEKSLFDLFSADGTIKTIRVLHAKHDPQNRFAFVTFDDAAATRKALNRNNEAFLGRAINVRPRRTSVPFRRTSSVQRSFNTAPSATLPEHFDTLAKPIRLGGVTSSAKSHSAPEGTPIKQKRGGNLPDRPPHWSPVRKNPSVVQTISAKEADERVNTVNEAQDGVSKHPLAPSFEQVYPSDQYQGASHPSGEVKYWLRPPPPVIAHPPTSAPLALMHGEFGSPYWHSISTDANGQQFVCHPLGGYCPCAPPLQQGGGGVPFGGPNGFQNEVQGQEPVNSGTSMQQKWPVEGSTIPTDGVAGEEQMMAHSSSHHWNASHPICPTIPSHYTDMWAAEQQQQQQQQVFPPIPSPAFFHSHLPSHHQQLQQQPQHIPCNPLNKYKEDVVPIRPHYYQGHVRLEGNPGPIQIPAWMNDSNC
ncbi:hypothetical protein CBS101457_000369 [Exobasidium rhododendri]|nr:hypothetical protein CBS101457_000369 [Exobasidium rhododendri]